MDDLRFTYWQDGDWFIGYLLDYPHYHTQGETLDDLKDHSVSLAEDIAADARLSEPRE